jgi:CheY-like chemotaxis protein
MSTRVLVVDDSPTIRRVVGAALQRAGHEVATAEATKDIGAQLMAFVPDIVLLAVTWPDAEDGIILLDEIVRTHSWNPPIIVMAARTDGPPGIDDRLRRLGVVDVITKPFAPETLLAVVRHALDKDAARKRQNAVSDFADDEHTVPALPRGGSTGWGPPTAVDISATGEPRRPRLPEGFSLVGDLAHVALPELLQLLKLQAHTGLLTVDTGELCVDVAFEDGAVVGVVGSDVEGAASRRAGLRLGRYLVAIGAIDAAGLETVVAATAGPGLLGERLVAAGVIAPEALRRAVAEQAHDLIVEVLRAHRGIFGLRTGPAHLPEAMVRPGWAVDGLLFEALRRIDEWAVIEREVPSFEARFAVRNVVDERDLADDELDILRALGTGPARVVDLITRSLLLPFDVCRVLYRLAILRRIQRVDNGDQMRLLGADRAPTEPLLSPLPRRGDA